MNRMRKTYNGRNNWHNSSNAIVRVRLDDVGGYLFIFESTYRTDHEDVESRREQYGKEECEAVSCAL